tara:strand:- start:292 stop:624 length:333 start_codon:yes stop_codon:yes gene_type:complete
MSITPATYNIQLYRRSDWTQVVVLEDSNGAMNLSGYSAACQFWTKDRTKKHCDVTTTITDASSGEITLTLADDKTALLPDTSYYDLRITTGTTSNYWLKGTVTANEGYTA